MVCFWPQISLAIASILDFAIGDPWHWPHPVQLMGKLIAQGTEFILKSFHSPQSQRWAGVILGLTLIGMAALVSDRIVWLANKGHPLLGIGIESILLASCFAGRSLHHAALDVLNHLQAGDLPNARQKLSLYVGRDTQTLNEPEILRAVLETIAENAIDGVTAPLFYAILGSLIPGLGGLPLAMGYKAASTLDSMIGYRESPYLYIGWFSAKLEDLLTWLPCRLTVITLGLLSGQLKKVWVLCKRDAVHDPSPNSGWSECVYAAILGVQLGGVNRYGTTIKIKPLLGDRIHPITPTSISKALSLTRHCFLIWLGLGISLGFRLSDWGLDLF
ncbi:MULTISPECIES: adenosylcobinamide-phosphate synthase CbiB [unclassified Roseofilum]|uniref:adenosylcobinamide-phosphate synthase CbiB n=1 Tax=unclassified Roseofilum TaxID=2620099 RepID=UPI000E9ADA2E|nr:MULTISPECIES: adenosylcobinamide-phosphate synthase CbiB [unclassified Roseofilum]MBP0009093.1 cobalamin biosynthesis protein [Roseofilum sp. Belize Diploria]MBP0031707.1 cobalamin biosynthesis protein [Roseofilum sp. Belize BBD 4]HBQ97784.1 cobalamin biosynthesis protein [Cyanobacteria bacterium UBA11691]